MLKNLIERHLPLPSRRTHGLVFLIFLLVAVAMRFFSLGYSVIDGDETTYLLISKAMLNGHTLYVDAWDTKPPGIFLLFSAVHLLFDNAILAVRILAIFMIAGTAFFLYRIVLHFMSKEIVPALFAGLFFLSAVSFQSFSFALSRIYGLEANTELFFVFLTVWALWQLLRAGDRLPGLFLAGLTTGLAFIIKYFVLFDILAFLTVITLLHHYQNRGKLWGKWFTKCLAFGLGTLIPFSLVLGYYRFVSPQYEAFHEVTFEVGSRYSNAFEFKNQLKFIGDFFYVASTVTLAFAGAIFLYFKNRKTVVAPWVLLWAIWMILTFVAASISGKFFFHYAIQIFPPFCLLAAHLFYSKNWANQAKMWRWAGIGVIVILVSIPVADWVKYDKYFSKPDYPREIAAYLNQQPEEDRSLFIINFPSVVYYLTDTYPPTKYYHVTLLSKADHIKALGVDQMEEFKKAFAKKPKYLVFDREKPSANFLFLAKKSYTEEKVFGDKFVLMRLNSE